jgi:hypothetical protein
MKKQNQGFAPIALIIAIVGVLVVSGGAYFLKKDSNPKMIPNYQENVVVKNNMSDDSSAVDVDKTKTVSGGTGISTSKDEYNRYVDPRNNNNQNTTKTYTYLNKEIKYDSVVWDLIENTYCSPGQMMNDENCRNVVGITFKFKKILDSSNDIYIGGHQPMECSVIKNATRCDDRFSIVTNSRVPEVLGFYDYLLSTLNK